MGTKNIQLSDFLHGFNMSKFMGEINTILTNKWISNNIVNNTITILFENEITEQEHTQIDTLVINHTAELSPTQKQAIYDNFKQLSGDLIELSDTEVKIQQVITVKENQVICKGMNIQAGSVTFNNEKTKNVVWPVEFESKPAVDLTLESVSTVPPYRINTTKAGCTIVFQTKYTGIVEWKATLI